MATKTTSYTRTKIKILLLESISDATVEGLKLRGYAEIGKIDGEISRAELVKSTGGVRDLTIHM